LLDSGEIKVVILWFFGADGKPLASARERGISSLPGDGNFGMAICFDGKRIAFARNDQTVGIWYTP
jgi:hypothetical protein